MERKGLITAFGNPVTLIGPELKIDSLPVQFLLSIKMK